MLNVKKTLTNIMLSLLGANKVLWGSMNDKNNWTSGNITVPNINKYCLFAVKPYGGATMMLAYRNPGDATFRAFGGYVNTTPNQFTFAFTATVSGTTMHFEKATNINVAGTSHTNIGITAIIGILPAWGGYCVTSVFSMLSALERWWEHAKREETVSEDYTLDTDIKRLEEWIFRVSQCLWRIIQSSEWFAELSARYRSQQHARAKWHLVYTSNGAKRFQVVRRRKRYRYGYVNKGNCKDDSGRGRRVIYSNANAAINPQRGWASC